MPPFSGPGVVLPASSPVWLPFTPSTVGVASDTGVCRYAVDGKLVFLALNLSGTSTSTSKSFTLPVTPANFAGLQWVFAVTVEDNGSTQTTPGEVVISGGNPSAAIFKNSGAAAWTGSGAWFAIGVGFYEIP